MTYRLDFECKPPFWRLGGQLAIDFLDCCKAGAHCAAIAPHPISVEGDSCCDALFPNIGVDCRYESGTLFGLHASSALGENNYYGITRRGELLQGTDNVLENLNAAR